MQSPDFLPYLHREFPVLASEWPPGLSRRRFLQLLGASLALAGLSGCSRQPQEKLVPYVRRPEEIVPGNPLYYATTFPLRGRGKGVLVRTESGRPIKIEGNPDHPASLGAADVFTQASILGLYDPDRSQVIRRGEAIQSRDAFRQFVASRVAAHAEDQGAGLFILTGTSGSLSLWDQMQRLHQKFPRLTWCEYEAAMPVRAHSTSRRLAVPNYDLSKTDVILSLDADFLGVGADSIALTKAFSERRRRPESDFSRFYAVESAPSITGVKADRRWRRKPSEIVLFAQQLAGAVLANDKSVAPEIQKLAADLRAHEGKSVVIAGDYQPKVIHALAFQLNQALNNLGATVRYFEEPEPVAARVGITEFLARLQSGDATTLLIAAANPVYSLPADADFASLLSRVPMSIHLGLYDDETGTRCQWHVPESHYLEAWGDVLAADNTPSLIQPVIQALYPAAFSLPEVLSLFVDLPPRPGYKIVRDFWERKFAPDQLNAWNQSLSKGVLVGLSSDAVPALVPVTSVANVNPGAPIDSTQLELALSPDPAVDDGRFANNAWLQELPRPMTKLTWDNVAALSPATAKRLGLASGDVARIEVGRRQIDAPIWIQPGHADECISVTLGYGRTNSGQVANGAGFNAGVLRSPDDPWVLKISNVTSTERQHELAATQHHFAMEGRDLIQVQTLVDYQADPARAREAEPEPLAKDDLYPPHQYKNYAWAMSVDLNSCIGCNACIIACQAENNIPVVGKEQVLRGREMHWLRVDRYFEGDPDEPAFHFQPVPCMQCEDAPCEVVCPVGATVHTSEGLNDMVYNRCVGTRYCSNNCPYKVRRFNFLKYDDTSHPTLTLQKNPDVTVRTRGVMEKCTYCVQRIEAGRIAAERDGRSIRDGEIVTACQQACPAEAIVFGNRNDPRSRVARLQAQPRNYALLAQLNTHPRTTYLAKIINPPTT